MKQNLKPFDLEAALQGAEVVTNSGLEVTEIHKFKTTNDPKVFAVINGEVVKVANGVYFNGHSWSKLFMKPQQVTKWVNIYALASGNFTTGEMFDTQEQALKEYSPFGSEPIETKQITFEI